MNTISRDELRERLERHDPLQLVMALGRWEFDQVHIPDSLCFENIDELLCTLHKEEEVVVYCTNPACPASYRVYHFLKSLGFNRISRLVGGIEEWVAAGLPVEGSQAKELAWTA